jgi:hypothetical protein
MTKDPVGILTMSNETSNASIDSTNYRSSTDILRRPTTASFAQSVTRNRTATIDDVQ